mmetsp:Transcript_21145/g.58283  ORF Transcript_21145/g.58283 Transcript_21145/m.58283 type:complete len:80 (-) Transcript_21145:98-337(-)
MRFIGVGVGIPDSYHEGQWFRIGPWFILVSSLSFVALRTSEPDPFYCTKQTCPVTIQWTLSSNVTPSLDLIAGLIHVLV